MPEGTTMLLGQYDHWLVLVSWLVATLASYTALDMAGRVASSADHVARNWLIGGAFAMGLGIWSMHFIGMLAFSLPIPIDYDVSLTLLSIVPAIAVSAFALKQVTAERLSVRRLVVSSVLMGVGIAAMHYTGMAAMRMSPGIEYDPLLFAVSIAIAVGASGAALWIFFLLRSDRAFISVHRFAAAIVMGLAIIGMHYTGMAAAGFPEGSVCMAAADKTLNTQWLALLIIVVTICVLAVALLTSVLDARMDARTSILANSLEQANRELSELALQDALTKLPNRLLLENRIEHAIERAKRESETFALLFMDLDGFKAVNDAYGHHFGDILLVDVAERIRELLRVQDTVGRIGGDEFVLLLESATADGAATVAERLVYSIARPFSLEGRDLRVSASVGISLYPNDGQTTQDLMSNADAAMYHVKHAGRNGYGFFETSMNINAREQMQLQNDLQSALERREFVLHYQPKYVAPAGPMTGVEALLRWQHPQRGMIPPDKFIPHAEKSGLIIPIGDWVLDEACRQMSMWYREGHTDWKVAVNLSAVQFSNPNLINGVRAALERHGLPAHCLTLEVTESTAMRNADVSLAILDRLSGMGVDISIDDFGTGYSSLLYLKRLPASELKIDRGFIQSLAENNEDAAIVSAIIALGQTLKLRIVAEGVETSAQQHFLTGLGCDVLQGYLLGRPMPADQVKLSMGQAEQKLKA
jgi:diguanylate cyclase (GGDEF)-like protein